MKVITIAGKAEAGKDYTALLLKEKLNYSGKRVLIIHYADYLKFIAKQYFGWSGNKDKEGRDLLQKLGTNKIRAKRPDFWVDTVINLLSVVYEDFDFVLIPDCRFKNEVNRMKKAYGSDCISVNVVRFNHENALTEEQRKHPSEVDLDGFKFDYVIESESGVNNLSEAVDRFVLNSNILKEA